MIKRNSILLLGLLLSLGVYSQTQSGQIIELTRNKDEIRLPNFDYATISIETELEKIGGKENGKFIPYEIRVDSIGSFKIDVSALKGDSLTLYFNSTNYSFLILKNVPRSNLADLIKVLPVVKNIWKSTCGSDCLTVDKKKTYKRKFLKVSFGQREIIFERKTSTIIPLVFTANIWPPDKACYYQYEYK